MANEKRLIDANALRERMFSYYGCVNENSSKEYYRGETLMNYEVADLIEDCIDNAPTVDAVEVVHGHWYEHHGITICSRCHSMFDTDLKMLQVPSTWKMPNYCPNCGAKMDGDGNV